MSRMPSASAREVRRVVVIGLLLLSWVLPAFAAVPDKPISAFYRETWTTREGLPHNQVNSIAQTPDGYLWLGTWEGLVRYNGLEFQLFDRGNTPALKDNAVRSLSVAADGAVVVGTSRGGVTVKRGNQWINYGEKDGLAQDEILDAIIDREGRLWAATENEGITLLDRGKATQFNVGNGLPSNVVFDLRETRTGEVWAATAGGLSVFVGGVRRNMPRDSGLPDAPMFVLFETRAGQLLVGTERGVFKRIGNTDHFEPLSPLLPQDGVPSLAEDREGNLWVGTVNNGLLRLSARNLDRFTSLRGLPNNRVPSLLVDREGSIWAGTNAGLLRLSDAPFSTWNVDQGLSDDYVRTVYEARDGGVWIGTGRGLNLWRDNRIVATYTADNGLPGDSILSLQEARNGDLLVGTYTEGLLRMRGGKVLARYDAARGLPASNQIRALAEAPDGSIWIGTNRGLAKLKDGRFMRYGMKEGLPREFIISLFFSRDGSLWVGTSNGAAHLVGDRFVPLDMRARNGAQDVFGFHEDADGTLWVATDRGLLRYRNGTLSGLGMADGLPVDTLFAIVDDGLGNYWLTSNRGVLRVTKSEANAVLDGRKRHVEYDHFGEADGLVSAQCNGGSGPSAMRDRLGNIWVATARGAAVASPASLHAFRRPLPGVVLEQILADGKTLPLGAKLALPAGTSKLEFRYAAISFLMPRFLRYRQRLIGMDSRWVDRGNQRSVQYTNLKAGDYRFEVSAAAPGLGQDWSPDFTTVRIDIQPHPWERPWVMALAVLAGLLLLWTLLRWRMASLHHRAAQLEQLIGQRTHDLQVHADRLHESDSEKSRLLSKLQEQAEAFERQAREDWLTGLGNRRWMDEWLESDFNLAATTGAPLSFALIDIDHFKRINDSYSHAAGDRALIEIARLMQQELGSHGKLARWGGEEFAALFPGEPLAAARQYCERLRRTVEAMDCSAFAPALRMTISVGVAERTGLAHYERMVSRADSLLYEAKHAGRNRVCG
ncbi:MAG: diguanylate cyclase [Xanthomonadaceae bacterium]|nr:diguanylate cyclase [Xanthomonadaceae bacterium]